MSKRDWLKKRTHGIHMTIRDIDCRDFDVEQLMRDFHEMHVEFFSFFAIGYVTTYPTQLKYQRMSPYLKGRDLTGEIVETAHKYGIKAIAMADLGVMSVEAALEHPEWCSLDQYGRPYKVNDEIYIASPLGGYQKQFAREMVEEIISRYDVDGIKFGGGSYGFESYDAGICYNEVCKRDFYDKYGEEIPMEKDWDSPVWKKFLKWRYEAASAQVKYLSDMVKSIDPDMLFMGNATCFGDPGWTTRASLDIEVMAQYQDTIQVEAQTRVRLDSDKNPSWESLTFPGEEANFLSCVTDKPAWVVCSYFLAWPWRRNAVPPVEQKVYLAQIATNGGSPMVNLSGGPPATHEDQRGFSAIQELYSYLDTHQDFYHDDSSAAEVAIVYSQETLVHYGKGTPKERYVDGIRGVEQALKEAHIPFDIISTKILHADVLKKYKTLVLPTLACMSGEVAQVLRDFVADGGSIVATFETSLYDEEGNKRADFLLNDLFRASYNGMTFGPLAGIVDDVQMNSYFRLNGSHPLLDGLDGTDVVPADGFYCSIVPEKDSTTIPLIFYPPFRVFPEGISYGTRTTADVPMAVTCEHHGGGRVVYFPTEIDKYYLRISYPDLRTLIVNAVNWTANADMPVVVDGPPTLDMTYRQQGQRRMVHLINLTGGKRFFTELVPLVDIRIGIRKEEGQSVSKIYLLSDKHDLPIQVNGKYIETTIPKLIDYDVLVFELS